MLLSLFLSSSSSLIIIIIIIITKKFINKNNPFLEKLSAGLRKNETNIGHQISCAIQLVPINFNFLGSCHEPEIFWFHT
jgi:hypothetical protein